MTKEIRRLQELAGLKRDNKFVLNELFNNPYSYKWIRQNDDLWQAEFETKDEHFVEMKIHIIKNTGDISAYMVFERDNIRTVTGQKDQFRIFATVLEIMKDFAENNVDIKEFWFHASQKSRASLYRRMLNRFANEINLNFEENKDGLATKFILSRKN